MQGEVTVPYTTIGGNNMNNGIMPLSLEGSYGGTESSTPTSFIVNWSLPGGINNKGLEAGNEGGAWGYILGRDQQDNVLYTDELFCEYLSTLPDGYKFNEQFELVNTELTASLVQKINELVIEYFIRVQRNDHGLDDEYDWTRLNNHYGSCMHWID